MHFNHFTLYSTNSSQLDEREAAIRLDLSTYRVDGDINENDNVKVKVKECV